MGDASDGLFALQAVGDEVGDGADFDVVFGGELFEFGAARHGAVFFEDFDDNGCGFESGKAGKVGAGFGVAGAGEDAAFARDDGEDVAGLDEVFRARVFGGGGEDGAGAVGGADAGGNAFGGFYGDGEGGVVGRVVAPRLWPEFELVVARLGDGEADEAAPVFRHEVDGFGGDVFGGDDQVAFVFAVFVIHEDDHFADADVVDDFRGGVQGHGFRIRVFAGFRG